MSRYLPGSGFGAGLGAGFFAGVEIPRLIRKNFNPLRIEAITLMGVILSDRRSVCRAVVAKPRRASYFSSDAAAAAVGAGPPRRTWRAAGGSGLSALAKSRLTCQISVPDISVL